MKIYIAGPMSGIVDFNYPAFDLAETMLQASNRDAEIINPANNFNRSQTRTKSEYLRAAIRQVLDVDAMYMLPYWQESRGARLEHEIASVLGLPIYELRDKRLEGAPDTTAQVAP